MLKSVNEVSWTELPISNLDKRRSYSSLLFKKYIILIGGVIEPSYDPNPFAGRGNPGFGGLGGGSQAFLLTNDIIMIDLEKNTWQKLLPSSYDLIPRFAHTACLYQENKIIIYGGIDRIGSRFDQTPTFPLNDVVEVTLSDTETPGIAIKTLKPEVRNNPGRAYHTCHIHQNQMFSFGGVVDQIFSQIGTSEMSRLDLEWTICQSSGEIPGTLDFLSYLNEIEGRYAHCSVLYKDKIYVLGGKMDTKYLDELYEFDIVSMRWTKITPQGSIQPMAFRSAVEKNGIIYTFGGEGLGRSLGPFGGAQITNSNELFAYNIMENKYQQMIPSGNQPKARTKNGIIVYKNNLLILGGVFDSTIYSTQISQEEESDKTEVQQDKGKNVFRGNHEDYVLQLKSLFLDGMYSDLTFKIQNEEIHAHRNILARRCKYFHNMFTSGMMESHSSVIKLDGVELTTFKALLEFVYCNEIKLDEKLALSLLELSDKYSFGELKEVCGRFLGQSLTLQNYVEFSKAAEKFDIENLKNAVLNFVTKNLRQIHQSDNLGDLPKPILWDIIFKLGLK